MDITIQDLLKGKSTVIKNKEFFETKRYVEPFIERMSKFTDDFRVQVKLPDQMTTINNNPDVTYNRVLLQAVLPEKYNVEGHQEVIGFLYGLDVKKPIVKIYRGMLNMACTNLTVFNPAWQNIQELVPGDPINFGPVKSVMESANDFITKIEKLKTSYIDGDKESRERNLGKWVDFTLRESQDHGYGKVKLSDSTSINAYKQLFIDADSPYYHPAGMDACKFDIYNAFTQVITDDKKDLMNKFDKTILISRLLDLN